MALRRRNRKVPPPLDEAAAYARSYGERSDDVIVVKPDSAPEPREAEARLTDRKVRDAFRTRLERRDDGR